MQAKQLLDYIIKPTLKYMGGNYNSKNAQMLLLATAAIESDCGYYIKQINGPALGIWQMEPDTFHDIFNNCDAVRESGFGCKVSELRTDYELEDSPLSLITSPMYACAVARLKYSMDKAALPNHNEIFEIYKYYKKIYNTPLGASTFQKFQFAWDKNMLDKVKL